MRSHQSNVPLHPLHFWKPLTEPDSPLTLHRSFSLPFPFYLYLSPFSSIFYISPWALLLLAFPLFGADISSENPLPFTSLFSVKVIFPFNIIIKSSPMPLTVLFFFFLPLSFPLSLSPSLFLSLYPCLYDKSLTPMSNFWLSLYQQKTFLLIKPLTTF